MTFFRPFPSKRYLPQNSVLFSMDPSAGDIFFVNPPVSGLKNPLLLISEALLMFQHL